MSKWLWLLLIPVAIIGGILLFSKKKVFGVKPPSPDIRTPSSPNNQIQLDITGSLDGSPISEHPAVINAATVASPDNPPSGTNTLRPGELTLYGVYEGRGVWGANPYLRGWQPTPGSNPDGSWSLADMYAAGYSPSDMTTRGY